MAMKGLTIESIKKHPALIPLYVFVGIGCGIATWYSFRLATQCPDVAWTKANNSEPWQAYSNKRYKIYDAGNDFKNVQQPPKF